jgi:hypothetical protein
MLYVKSNKIYNWFSKIISHQKIIKSIINLNYNIIYFGSNFFKNLGNKKNKIYHSIKLKVY